MIFRKLFRPKYQDPNPQVRIQAIATLSPSENEHKTHLHELAFNDEDPNVNLAALKRLNSFALWCKMADTAKLDRVRKKAQSTVEQALFEQGELSLSDNERITFIRECKNISLLEKLITLPWLQQGDGAMLKQVLAKIDKPHVTHNLFIQAQSEPVQLSLLENIDDTNILNKALKKTPFSAVKQKIEAKLAAISEAKLKPIEIEKNTRLILSKLLALKDVADLPKLQDKKAQLTAQYRACQEQFNCLTQDVNQSLSERFVEIEQRLERIIEQLMPQWQGQQAKHKAWQQLDNIESNITAILQQVNVLLEGDIAQVTLGEVERFEQSLQQLEQQLQQMHDENNVHDADVNQRQSALLRRIQQSRATLARLPEFQNAVLQAQTQLDKMTALSLPNDISQIEASEAYLKEQREQWNELRQNYNDSWPQTLNQQWSTVQNAWRNALVVLKEQVKQNESRVRAKIRAIDNLVEQGKFNAAMGLFNRVQSWYVDLPEKQQQVLARSFDKAKDQIDNLKDLQHYIAKPRKPAMLAEAEAIALNPLDINQQAKEVKRLRKEWSSLGNSDTEADQLLNKAFDLAIEKAFEPCRVYFAQQDQIREQNLKLKLDVLAQLEALHDETLGPTELVEKYGQLTSKWREIGRIDYTKLGELNGQYRAVTIPLKEKIQLFYGQNAEQKQSLLKQAESLLQMEDIVAAVEKAKQLQQKWKDIDSAGRKLESKLWSTFRAINDQVFAKRQQHSDTLKQESKQLNSQLESQWQVIEGALSSAQTIADFNAIENDTQTFAQSLLEMPDQLSKQYQLKIGKLLDSVEQGKRDWAGKQKSQELHTVFSLLEDWQEAQPNAEQLATLPNALQQSFKQCDVNPDWDRHKITVVLEILAEVESPKSDQALRKALQLQLMSDKLQNGEQPDKSDLLEQWIKQGPVTQQDKKLLTRIKPLFIN